MHQTLKAPPGNMERTIAKFYELFNCFISLANDHGAMSVVTQTSFNMTDSINSSVWRNMQADRICPLCENAFPTLISQEEFEDHVMEHFNGEDNLLPEFEILS